MKKFEEPVFDMIKLNTQDVVTTSGGCGDAMAIVPPMTFGDADGCGFGPCGPNDVFFD